MDNLEARLSTIPEWSTDPIERLRHTLAVIGDQLPDSDHMVTATAGCESIIGHDWTGLTLGDLRALLAWVDALESIQPFVVTAG